LQKQADIQAVGLITLIPGGGGQHTKYCKVSSMAGRSSWAWNLCSFSCFL